MVYVDSLRNWGWVINGRKTQSCHLIADTPDELHEIAGKIGLKRSWYQGPGKASFPHYDLVPSKREEALGLGTQAISRREFALVARSVRRCVKEKGGWSLAGW